MHHVASACGRPCMLNSVPLLTVVLCTIVPFTFLYLAVSEITARLFEKDRREDRMKGRQTSDENIKWFKTKATDRVRWAI